MKEGAGACVRTQLDSLKAVHNILHVLFISSNIIIVALNMNSPKWGISIKVYTKTLIITTSCTQKFAIKNYKTYTLQGSIQKCGKAEEPTEFQNCTAATFILLCINFLKVYGGGSIRSRREGKGLPPPTAPLYCIYNIQLLDTQNYSYIYIIYTSRTVNSLLVLPCEKCYNTIYIFYSNCSFRNLIYFNILHCMYIGNCHKLKDILS